MADLQLLSLADAAGLLAVSARTVRRMVSRGEIPSYKVGHQVRVRASDLETYITSCKNAVYPITDWRVDHDQLKKRAEDEVRG